MYGKIISNQKRSKCTKAYGSTQKVIVNKKLTSWQLSAYCKMLSNPFTVPFFSIVACSYKDCRIGSGQKRCSTSINITIDHLNWCNTSTNQRLAQNSTMWDHISTSEGALCVYFTFMYPREQHCTLTIPLLCSW